MSQKLTKWIVVLLMFLPLALVACDGTTPEIPAEVQATVESAVEQAATAVEEGAPEEIATAVVEQIEEAATEVAEVVEEVATEAPMEEPTEVPMEEPMEEDPCAPATDGPLAGVDLTGQTVVWWHNHSDSREELLLEIVADYNETNPCGITIEAINQGGYNDIRNAVNASVASGEVPATLVVGYQNDQEFYQLNNSLVDLNTYLNDAKWGLSEEEQAAFYQSFFNQSIHPLFDNQRLGFPPNRSIEMLHYNKTYLEELGFDAPPATPEEFVEMSCAAAEASESGVGGFVLRDDASAVAAWTFAFGGDVSTADGLGYDYSGDATKQAMAMLQELATEGEDGKICAYLFDGFPNPEVAARHALFGMGSSSGIPFYEGDFATIAEEAGTEPDEYAVAAIPHTTADPVMNIYGGDVMIVQTTPEAQLAAWDFVKWFTSPEGQARWVEASQYFPTNSGATALLGDFLEANPVYASALDLLNYGKYEPQLISYTAVRDAAQAAFNQIMAGADIDSTLEQLTTDANELQAELMSEIE